MHNTFVTPSAGSTLAFLAVVLFVYLSLSIATYRALRARASTTPWFGPLALGAWLLLTAGISASGVLERNTLPPPLMLFFFGSNLTALLFALSPLGRTIASTASPVALIAFQSFRLPLELVLHQWWREGVIPIEMTYEGYNFDIVTGIVSLFSAFALHKRWVSKTIVLPVNLLGTVLLLAVGTIATLSSPVPFRRFFSGPALLLAFHPPYSWIVTVCVAGALVGHVLTYRWWLLRSHDSGLENH